jgi:hypothetical protein
MVRVSRAGWRLVLIPLVAAYLFGKARHPAQLWLSIGVAAVVFWSLGVMHNYAYTRDEPQAAPDWAATICILGSLVGIAMLVWALVA